MVVGGGGGGGEEWAVCEGFWWPTALIGWIRMEAGGRNLVAVCGP